MRTRMSPSLLVAAVFAATSSASAEPYATVIRHFGTNDPTGSEGWTADAEVEGEFGPVLDVGGVPAWFTDDSSSTVESGAYYVKYLSAIQLAQAAESGWRLAFRVRVVDVPDFASRQFGGVMLHYADGTRIWMLHLGSEADGDPTVFAVGGETLTLQGGGAGYHLYELVVDPGDGTTDLFVDGIEQISDLSAELSSIAPTVGWGNSSGADTGHANYNLVEFQLGAQPIPSLNGWGQASVVALLLWVGVVCATPIQALDRAVHPS